MERDWTQQREGVRTAQVPVRIDKGRLGGEIHSYWGSRGGHTTFGPEPWGHAFHGQDTPSESPLEADAPRARHPPRVLLS